MMKIKKDFSPKKLVLSLICIVSVLFLTGFSIYGNCIAKGLDSQNAASRWKKEGGVAQISCFFSVNGGMTQERIEEFEHALDEALEAASIVVESPNANARLWADAYSASGKISVTSNLATITTDCIGIGGDFFLFHPLQLLSGSYFSGNDVMQDYCVLDRNAAWKLFGSNDVAGQIVYINDVAHVVTGVVKHEENELYQAAGLDGSMIYVSYDSLKKYGTNNGINHFEIVMPNPVKDYAKKYVDGAIGVSKEEMEIVDNSARFRVLNRIRHIQKLPARAMNGKAIIYPYWENVARVKEDISARVMIWQLIFLGIVVIMISGMVITGWKHRKWSFKSILNGGKDKLIMQLSLNRIRRNYKKKRKEREC